MLDYGCDDGLRNLEKLIYLSIVIGWVHDGRWSFEVGIRIYPSAIYH